MKEEEETPTSLLQAGSRPGGFALMRPGYNLLISLLAHPYLFWPIMVRFLSVTDFIIALGCSKTSSVFFHWVFLYHLPAARRI